MLDARADGTDVAGALVPLVGLRRPVIFTMTVIVTNHDIGRVVWAAEDRNQATVAAFFDELGTERARQLRHVSRRWSSESAWWFVSALRRRGVLDAFHVARQIPVPG